MRPSIAFFLLLGLSSAVAAPSVVHLTQAKDHFMLTRDGQPYVPKGFGLANDCGPETLATIKQTGANSFRTWGANQRTGALLDEAQRLGLTVCLGIWIEHQSDTVNYRDAATVRRQLAEVCETVLAYKDHPALLLWGLGNELEGYAANAGDDPVVWKYIDLLAATVKKIDPNHPTMTTLAEIGGRKVANLNRYCPHLDIVGINSYGGLASFPARYRAAGGIKPYLVTEFGPRGSWESPLTSWKAPIEATSTAKAELYRAGYAATVQHDRSGLCLGAYAFLWGHKQEMTATWYGVLLPDGSRLAAVDTLQELWTGQPPANRVPRIDALAWQGADRVAPGGELRATLKAADAEDDPLQAAWLVRTDDTGVKFGGQTEIEQENLPDAVVAADNHGATIRGPSSPGAYRLFVTVKDQHGGAATGNLPFLVGKAK